MSLFLDENILTKEIESWRVFANSLKSAEEKRMFLEMLEKCQKYALAINAKGKPFPTEPLIMAHLLEQHHQFHAHAEASGVEPNKVRPPVTKEPSIANIFRILIVMAIEGIS